MYCFTRYLLRTVKVASGRILPVVERQTWSCRKALYLSPQYSIVCVSSSSPALSVKNGLKKYKIEIKMPLLEGTFDQETATEYLSNLNEEEKKRLKLYKLEYELWMSSGLVSCINVLRSKGAVSCINMLKSKGAVSCINMLRAIN